MKCPRCGSRELETTTEGTIWIEPKPDNWEDIEEHAKGKCFECGFKWNSIEELREARAKEIMIHGYELQDVGKDQ